MAASQQLATLIGDVVDSKLQGDRSNLQRTLSAVLDSVNHRLQPVQALDLTLGDEFQGAFPDVVSAIEASLWLRLELLASDVEVDSRYGVGYGDVNVFDAHRKPVSQDGSGWWSARSSIARAKALAEAPRTSFVRTCFGYWPDDNSDARDHDAAAMESFLLCRDAIIGQMNSRQRRLLLGFMRGRQQAELAADEGITQGAVSQSLHRGGAFAIIAAQSRLRES